MRASGMTDEEIAELVGIESEHKMDNEEREKEF